jgi:cytochrome P450
VLPELPVPELATCRHPGDQYAELRARGVHCRDGAWVVARPDDVAAALASPGLSVALPHSPEGRAAQLQSQMARFSDGTDHARRRALVEALLPDPTGLEQQAARRAGEVLEPGRGVVDAMPVARTAPIATLAAALGVPAADVARVVTMTGRLCDGLAPPLDARPVARTEVDAAAVLLSASALVAPAGADRPADDEAVAAAVSLLFQARDATAALIGAALLINADADDADHGIARALRQELPVQCTRRTARADVEIGGTTLPRGAPVWVLLAAAETGPPAPPATFGSGPHACPGAALAEVLARGVVAGIHGAGWRAVPGQPVTYEPRPNLRLPTQVLMQQR